MQLIFVIQVVFRICQGSRLFGSINCVKGIDTPVHFFFTPSRLFSYINHLAKKARFIVALSLFLLAFGNTALFAQVAGDYQSNKVSMVWTTAGDWQIWNGTAWVPATTYPGEIVGTGAVTILAGHNVSISSNITTVTLGTVIINGTLSISATTVFDLKTLQLTVTENLTPVANIDFGNKAELYLPLFSTIYVTNGGLIGTGNNTGIYIGSAYYAADGEGHDAVGNFPDLSSPTITSTTPAARCGAGTVILSATSSAGSTVSWYATPTGGTAIGSLSPFTSPTISATTTYYAEAKNTITGFISSPRTVIVATINTNPVAPMVTVVDNCGTSTLTASGFTGNLLWSIGATTASISVNAAGTYTVTQTINGCTSLSGTGTATPKTIPVGTPVFALGASSSRPQLAQKILYTATANYASTITYTLDANSITAGNSIDPNTGEVNYLAGWSGISVITAKATGCGISTTAIHTVTTVTSTIGATWCFALFTQTGAITNNGSTVKGNVGTNAGAITGFTAANLDGNISEAGDPVSVQASADVLNAYTDLNAIACGQIVSGTSLGSGQTLTPKVYCLGGALNISGDLILDAQGDPNALFIFKVGGALSTLTNARIMLINGASKYNVYWRVYGAVELNTGTQFSGTIVGEGAITLNGSTLNGRALAIVGAIVLNGSVITSNCSPMIVVGSTNKPTFTTSGPFGFCVENIQQAVYDPLAIDIISPDRPDYYTLKAGDPSFDINPATYASPDCAIAVGYILHWSITDNADQPVKSVINVFLTNITGQVSDYTKATSATTTDIIFRGAANSVVTYKIIYWLEDPCGKLSDLKVNTITINPRPKIQ